MIIRSVNLKNIRSYKDGLIEIPEGTVLLSGDIGAGKSTILLALEFALFGVRTGLSGNTLLRKGSKQGSIELTFSIDNKEITICRSLKKGKSDIKQEPGFLIIDGTKTSLTALELKAKIIELLGYPKDMLTKQKNIFRYTVYTPQEDMKAILFEEKDARLNTLRKVFGIDKYKIIRENCSQYNKSLKERRKELGGRIYDLQEKKATLANKTKITKELKKKLEKLLPVHEKLSRELTKSSDELTVIEKQIRNLTDINSQIKLLDNEIKSILARRAEIQERMKIIMDLINQKLPKHESLVELKDKLGKCDDDLTIVTNQIETLNLKMQVHRTKIEQSEKNKEKITEIDTCPMCEQDVPHSHKGRIIKREIDNIETNRMSLEKKSQEILKLNILMSQKRKTLEKLRADYSETLVLVEKSKQIEHKKKEIDLMQNELDDFKKKIGKINQEKIVLKEKHKELPTTEESLEIQKKAIEKLTKDERDSAISVVQVKTELASVTNEIENLNIEINKKNEQKSVLQQITDKQNWLEDTFIKLTVSMEKHVMSRLYHDFNDSFTNWFHMLMDDESISAKLDEAFNPLIEQNGYDTELGNLSGGEKTSVALAYRLALNKVINDFISHIKTRDIIILDEPTDGFSDEQLDRVREVIDALGIKQIIIVSHESKVESFVDSIIRVTKASHESQAVRVI